MNKPHAILLVLVLALTGCAATPDKPAPAGPVMHPASEFLRDDVTYVVDVYDPWEGMNRSIYKFNARFDQYLFLPAVDVYETILPEFAQKGISNFYSNFSEVSNVMNSILQL